MNLRTAGVADAQALAGLCLLVFLDTYCVNGLRADLSAEALQTGDVQALRERLQDPRWCGLLVEQTVGDEPHVLGYASLRQDGERAELARLYLHPRFQGQGLGRRLLRAAEAQARAGGAASLWLDCWSGNSNALAFYAACGYRDEGPAEYRFGGRAYANHRLVRRLA